MVSYTDTTLVSNHDIEFKFRYIPDIKTQRSSNREVSLVGELDGNGNVLKGLKYTIDYADGKEAGWATVTFRVNDPSDIKQVQQITLNVADNPNLQKTITFTLMKPYTLQVICYDRNNKNQTVKNPDNVIPTGIAQELGVYLRIPDELTRDMFPLEFKIEADKLSISPDASEGNTMPVVSGKSIIPGKTEPAFYYLFTIETYEVYQSLLVEEDNHTKLAITRWLTNMVNSASYVVVDNKYFNIAASYFRNSDTQTEDEVLGHKRRYTDLRIDPNPVFFGVDQPVKIMFDLDSREQKFLPKTVRVKLEGMVCTKHGDTEFDMFLSENPMTDTIGRNLPKTTKIVKMQPGTRSVIVDGLKTTVADHSDVYDGKGTSDISDDTGPIRFTLNPENPSEGGVYDQAYYQVTSDVATRIAPAFTMLSISPNPVLTGTGIPVTLKFLMDADDDKYFDRNVIITLNGLKDKDTGATEITVKPTEGSLRVLLDNLVTYTEDDDISFSVRTEDGEYTPRTSETITRRNAEFWGLVINPTKVAQGADKKLSISFNMDEDDDNFATREITLTLTGMKYVHPQTKQALTTLKFTPSKFPKLTRYMTIGDLVTTDETGNVSFTVSASGYADATATAQRSEVEFRNLSFTRDGDIVSRINEGETVDFNFTMSYYEEGMAVDVTLDGFEPYDMPTSGDGSLVPAATRAATSYVFTPFERNCKLKLRAVSTTSASYSVGLAAESYGFAPASAGISKAIHKFDATASTKKITSINDVVTINFYIPNNAWESGQTKMPVKITLGRLLPADSKLEDSNGSYVYNVTKNANSSTLYSFTVKPFEDEAGRCTVKLEADAFFSQTIDDIVQTVNHALKMTNYVNVGNNESWRAQVSYQLSQPMARNTQYTFTCMIKSSVTNQVGIFIKNTDGQQQATYNISISNITAGWSKCTVNFTTDNNNDYNLLMFNIGTFVGDVYMDDISLVRTNDNNKTNLIVNPDFENGIDGWDISLNNDNNSNPRCEVTVVKEPK